MKVPLPSMSSRPTAPIAGMRRRVGPPGRPGHDDDRADQHRLGRPDEDQRPERVTVADLRDADAQRPESDGGDQRDPEARRPIAGITHPRNQHDRRDRGRDPEQDERLRDSLEQDPGRDRDDGGDDTGDRRHDAHPPDCESLVQRRDADPAGDPGQDAPEEVSRRRRRLGANDRQPQSQDHPDQLRDEHHAEERCPPSEQALRRSRRSPR